MIWCIQIISFCYTRMTEYCKQTGGEFMLKIKMKLTEVDYEQIAERFIPEAFVKPSGGNNIAMKLAGKLLVKDGETSALAKGILNLIPQQTMDTFAYHLVLRNLERFREGMNQFLAKELPGLQIEALNILDTDKAVYDVIKLEISLEEINYKLVLEQLLPRLLEQMAQKQDKSGDLARIFLGMNEVPAKMAVAAFDTLSQEAKNHLLVQILSLYREEIAEGANAGLQQQKISAKVAGINFSD